MLSPVNNAGLNTCQWGSHGWARGEEGEWGDPADAVEKGELTPVKWLIKVRGYHSGGPTQDKTVRETQNPIWQTEHYAGHKPQTGSPRFRRYFYWTYLHRRNTPHAWNADDRCFYFPTQRRSMPSLFYLTAGWWVDLNFVSIVYAPKYNAFRPMCGFFYLFILINEVHSVKRVTTIGATDGSHALGPAREWQEQMWHLLSLALPVPPTLVSPLCCM